LIDFCQGEGQETPKELSSLTRETYSKEIQKPELTRLLTIRCSSDRIEISVHEQEIPDFPGGCEEKEKNDRESPDQGRAKCRRSAFSLSRRSIVEKKLRGRRKILNNGWMNSRHKVLRNLKTEITRLDD
jgi:hypothetical protein